MPAPNQNKKILTTLTKLVDDLCLREQEAQLSLETSVQSEKAWLTSEVEACKQKRYEFSRRGRVRGKKSAPVAAVAPSVAPSLSENDTKCAAAVPPPRSEKKVRMNVASPVPSSNDSIEKKVRLKVEAHRVKSLKKKLKKRGMTAGGVKKDLRERLVEALVREEAEKRMQQQSTDTLASLTTATDPKADLTAVVEQIEHVAIVEDVEKCPKESENKGPVEVLVDDNMTEPIDETVPDQTTAAMSKPIASENCKFDEIVVLEGPSSNSDGNNDVIAMEHEFASATSTVLASVENTSASPQNQAFLSKKTDGSGRKRVRSPMKYVQSAIQKLSSSTTNKSPVQNKKAKQTTTNRGSLEQKDNVPLLLSDHSKPMSDDNTPQDMDVDEHKEEATENQAQKPFPPTQSLVSSSKGPVRLLAGLSAPGSATSTSWSVERMKQISASQAAAINAKNEERKARIEDLRNKSKPVSSSKTLTAPNNYTKTLSSLKITKTEEGSRLAAIREKALGPKSGLATTMTTTHATSTVPTSLLKKAAEKKTVVAKLSSPRSHSAMKKKDVQSPMDTYEMSDHEGDTEESDDESSRRGKPKYIPQWARKSNLNAALEYQFSVDQHTLDPDEIFGEVLTCDLNAIFNMEKTRYKKRTSSGIWTTDRATSTEKMAYKRAIQQDSICA